MYLARLRNKSPNCCLIKHYPLHMQLWKVGISCAIVVSWKFKFFENTVITMMQGKCKGWIVWIFLGKIKIEKVTKGWKYKLYQSVKSFFLSREQNYTLAKFWKLFTARNTGHIIQRRAWINNYKLPNNILIKLGKYLPCIDVEISVL
jgi:hypothetical protein